MSYRENRNFIEMLCALGYPSLVSMESFRTPNFPLVADLLVWLIKRFDPDADIPSDIGTEDGRVKLVRNAAQFMALKANVRLNTKRLYQADVYAIKELLKITALLYGALDVNLDEKDDDVVEEAFNLRNFDLSDKVDELKLSRQLASEITGSGATLFDLLGKEIDLRSVRLKSVSRQFELNDVENGIKKAIDVVKKEIQETQQLIDNVSGNEASLDAKIDRRKVEIDRYEKRLQTLKKVRPAFLEEFTALETELEQLFVQYSTRLRILNQLECQFKDAERAQYEKQLLMASPKIETIPLDEGTQNTDVFMALEENQRQERPRASTGSRRGGIKAYGGMQPPLSATPSSLNSSSDTESDDLFIDKDEPELIQSDDGSLTLEIERRSSPKSRGIRSSSKMQHSNSDDDF